MTLCSAQTFQVRLGFLSVEDLGGWGDLGTGAGLWWRGVYGTACHGYRSLCERPEIPNCELKGLVKRADGTHVLLVAYIEI